MLKDEADLTLLHRQGGGIRSTEEDLPAIRLRQSRDDAQKRRLSGSGWSEQRQEFSGLHRQIDIVERGRTCERLRHTGDADVDRLTLLSDAGHRRDRIHDATREMT